MDRDAGYSVGLCLDCSLAKFTKEEGLTMTAPLSPQEMRVYMERWIRHTESQERKISDLFTQLQELTNKYNQELGDTQRELDNTRAGIATRLGALEAQIRELELVRVTMETEHNGAITALAAVLEIPATPDFRSFIDQAVSLVEAAKEQFRATLGVVVRQKG